MGLLSGVEQVILCVNCVCVQSRLPWRGEGLAPGKLWRCGFGPAVLLSLPCLTLWPRVALLGEGRGAQDFRQPSPWQLRTAEEEADGPLRGLCEWWLPFQFSLRLPLSPPSRTRGRGHHPSLNEKLLLLPPFPVDGEGGGCLSLFRTAASGLTFQGPSLQEVGTAPESH